MDWESLGPISLVLTAASAAVGGAVEWVDTVRQRRRAQMIEALQYRLKAEEEDHAETERERDEARAERDRVREAYRYAAAVARAYERQLLSAGITPDPTWEEPHV